MKTCITQFPYFTEVCSCFTVLYFLSKQIMKARTKYVKEWRKRKRIVSQLFVGGDFNTFSI